MSGKKGEHEPEKEGVLATIWDYAKTFLIIFLVVFALNKLVYINAVIPSESMQTTIMKGDRIIGSRLAYKSKDPQRFMMGDNRNNSLDSRYWKKHFVEKDAILAKAVFRYWPFSEIGKVE